ncbi:MAG: hypothetical protein DRN42_04265 [Thermoplasmata archaeon]|nr:MAG: hypothetical protein DRN40_05780 [Thermoplasmata archaeon]RLF74657.1 MAG: hypothetical protein DRN42_04265 [Thermoplasmata archaeon]HDD59611.1 hypothetical protein [Euryarchaeota archaeon]
MGCQGSIKGDYIILVEHSSALRGGYYHIWFCVHLYHVLLRFDNSISGNIIRSELNQILVPFW